MVQVMPVLQQRAMGTRFSMQRKTACARCCSDWAAGIEPGIVGLVDEPARTVAHGLDRERCNDVFETDEHGEGRLVLKREQCAFRSAGKVDLDRRKLAHEFGKGYILAEGHKVLLVVFGHLGAVGSEKDRAVVVRAGGFRIPHIHRADEQRVALRDHAPDEILTRLADAHKIGQRGFRPDDQVDAIDPRGGFGKDFEGVADLLILFPVPFFRLRDIGLHKCDLYGLLRHRWIEKNMEPVGDGECDRQQAQHQFPMRAVVLHADAANVLVERNE